MRTLLALLLLAGCKGGSAALPPPKMDTARATAGSFAAAVKVRSLDGIVALLPHEEQLAGVLDCDVAALAQKLKDHVDRDLKELPEGNTIEIGAFDKYGSEDKAYKAGDEFEGCKVKAPFAEHRAKVELHLVHDSKTDFKDAVMRFVQFPGDDKWYYLR
jgi:hypothetical protein